MTFRRSRGHLKSVLSAATSKGPHSDLSYLSRLRGGEERVYTCVCLPVLTLWACKLWQIFWALFFCLLADPFATALLHDDDVKRKVTARFSKELS